MEKLGKYNKTLVAGVAVLLTGLNVLYGTNEYVQLAISVATVLGVYQVRNDK